MIKHPFVNLIVFTFAISLIACNKNEMNSEYASADSTSSNESYSNNNIGSEKTKNNNKIIRTADLKFRVNNVTKTSEQLEDLITQNNGYISFSNHNVNITNQETIQISPDSSVERICFNETNLITIKVPNQMLDITLRQISSMVEFLNSKTLKAEDVQLELLSNQLKMKRNSNFQKNINNKQNIAISKNNNLLSIEDSKLEKQIISDEALINNLNINQQVDFSTITLEIYQRNSFRDIKVAFEKSIKPYEDPFYLKFWNSITLGILILENIILGITKLWVLIIVAILGYLIYKKQYKS